MEEEKRRTIEFEQSKTAYAQRKRINHLLLIAINEYAGNFSPLSNCIKDAEDVSKVLLENYNFEEAHVLRLYNEDASIRNIFDTLRAYAEKLGEDDSLVIYFAGHGDEDKILEEGYWIPQNAKQNERHGWLDNTRLVGILEKIKAHHILLLVDSCFSGTLFFRTKSSANRYDRAPSRYVITSGSKEVVSDGKAGENSPFAKEILYYLEYHEAEAIKASDLANHLKNVPFKYQTPNGSAILMEGHKNGEFVFYKKGFNPALAREPEKPLHTFRGEIHPPSHTKRHKGKGLSQYGPLIGLSLSLLLIILIGLRSFQKVNNLEVEFDLRCSSISFEYLDGPKLFTDLKTDYLQISPVKLARLPIDNLTISSQKIGKQQYTHLESSGIQLKEDDFLENARMFFKGVNVSRFDFSKGSKLNLTVPPKENDTLELSIGLKSKDDIIFDLGFSQDLWLEFSDMFLEGIPKISSDEAFSFLRLESGLPSGNIFVQGKKGDSKILMESKDLHGLFEQKLTVRDISFFQADQAIGGEKRRLSSVEGAHVRFFHGQTLYDSLSLARGDDFFLSESASILLDRLELDGRGINIQGRGDFSP
ncbi:MAG: caspase family protein, partial [Bacteroidota bacterium]